MPRLPWALIVLLVLLLAVLAFPRQADGSHAERPCGPWTPLCESALEEFGLGGDARTLEIFGTVMWCESRFNTQVRGHVDSRDRGLWQINAFYHPDVTDAMAFSPVVSTRWAAWKFARGEAYIWACWRPERWGRSSQFVRDVPVTFPATPSITATLARLANLRPAASAVVMAPPAWLRELVALLSQQSHRTPPPPFWTWGGFP